MKTILIVFGTRPEAIKMAPLVKEFKKFPNTFETLVCVTAQHREMLDQVLSIFEIVPDFDLNIMKEGQDLYDVTSCVLLGMRKVLKESNPQIVLVHGDTTTSTATALAAFYQKIPVGHIEAGLRTHNIYSPWPEEINRQITARVSTFHFTPTVVSQKNLINEGINLEKIFITGNTVIDALCWVLNKIESSASVQASIFEKLRIEGIDELLIGSWKEKKRKLILITGHRRENFGDGFIHICGALKELAAMYTGADFIYPMHLNPNVRNPIKNIFGISDFTGNRKFENFMFLEPLDYLTFVYLMSLSNVILTDSGGVQEEAPSLGKPVLVMRNTSERPEAIDAGTVKLVGTDKQTIINAVRELMDNSNSYNLMSKAVNPYGDGKASEKILDIISKEIE